MKNVPFLLVASLCLSLTISPSAYAKCSGSMFNPITDITWEGIFPIKIGGVTVVKGDAGLPDSGGGTGSPICFCSRGSNGLPYLGLGISFWEPADLIEVVRDPYCSPALGTSFQGLDDGYHGGTNSQKVEAPFTFKQVHWVKFPLFAILGLLADVKCLTKGGFDYAVMSELDPTHNDSTLAALMDPRAFLFANPAFDFSCATRSAAVQAPVGNIVEAVDSLFWCSWGSIYPLTGDRSSAFDLESSAAIGAKMLYKMTTYGLHLDHASNICSPTLNPIWKQSHYRMQLAKPVRGRPFILGQSDLLWGSGKNPPFKDGNFLFVLFQKHRCCEPLGMGGR